MEFQRNLTTMIQFGGKYEFDGGKYSFDKTSLIKFCDGGKYSLDNLADSTSFDSIGKSKGSV
jgi:hypothetical protein